MHTPGVEPVNLKAIWALIRESASSWSQVNAPRLGAALAFYTMLSIAPLLVISIAIAGLVFGDQAAHGQIMYQIEGVVGPQSAGALQDLLAHAAKPAAGVPATIAGVFMLLFGASGVFGELRDSLNLVWGAKSSSGSGLIGMIKYRFVSFAMVLGIGFLLLVSLLLSAAIAAAGQFFGSYLPVSEAALQLGNMAFSFLAVTVLFALLYKLVPDVEIEWRDVAIGAAVTSLLFSIGKLLIGLYLGKAGVGSTYGAAGSFAVFIIWVYYSAQIFFLGAQFTHVFAERHGSRARARQGIAPPSAAASRRFRRPELA
jgi:membrane protein